MHSAMIDPAVLEQPTNNDRGLVDLIERATDDQASCPCGRHTTVVARDGAIWLECSGRLEPATSRLGRVVRFLTDAAHVHEVIVDLPETAESGSIPIAA